jgi:hypothetical protein
MAVTVRVESAEVRAMLVAVPGLLAHHVREEWGKQGKLFRESVAKNFGAAHPAKARRARKWVLDRMTQYRKGPGDPGVRPGDAHLGIFVTSPLLEAHERGLEITDPNGGAMAIPMGDAASAKIRRAKKAFVSGPKNAFTPSLFKEVRGLKKTRLDNEFKVINLRGRLYLAELGPTGEILTIYARIVKSVKLKATLGFYSVWQRLAPERDAAIERAVRSTIAQLKRTPPTWAAVAEEGHFRKGREG